MKLLFISDLHCDDRKLGWILARAGAFDAILVAGDLLDIFRPVGCEEQQDKILRWKADLLATGTPLAWCSGNHDFFHGEDSPVNVASPAWMTGRDRSFIGDGITDILHARSGDLAVTTVPWPVTGADVFTGGTHVPYLDFVADLLDQGRRLQARYPWMTPMIEDASVRASRPLISVSRTSFELLLGSSTCFSKIDMTDFESLDALEDGFTRLSGIAFKTAHDQVLAAGGSVAVLENGAVYEVFPDGRRVFIHAVKEPVHVQVGARYVRRDARPK